MARCIIHAGAASRLWQGAHTPPPELLARAHEYVSVVAQGMQLSGPGGVAALLEGEAIALLLKQVGTTLAAREQGTEARASRPVAPGAGLGSSVTTTASAAVDAPVAPSRRQRQRGGAASSLEQQQKQQHQTKQQQKQNKQRKEQQQLQLEGEDMLTGLEAEKLQGLRALVLLMHLLEGQLGSHALQVWWCVAQHHTLLSTLNVRE
jgi:hypothetical protein